MHRIVTARQMKELDRFAIERLGIPGIVLMENAGRRTVELAEAELGSLEGRRVAVVCGTGNNGGDGFVACRHLAERRARPTCLLLGRADSLEGDALASCRKLLDAGHKLHEVSDKEQLALPLADAELVFDAIFGTGLSRPAEGLLADAINAINASGRPVVSIDVPSGVDADSGRLFEPAVRARLTVTMALPKLGHVLHPGAACTGRLRVADIGMPPEVLEKDADTMLVDAEYVASVLPRRPAHGHKGTFGTALLVCGSRGFSGAACLAGMAAVRSGCGLVILAVPEGIADVVAARVVEAVKLPLPQTPVQTLAPEAAVPVLEAARSARAVAIGPGITIHPPAGETLCRLLPELELPMVLDADAVNHLAKNRPLLSRLKAPVVLTPHPGELARLTGIPAAALNSDRVEACRRFAVEHKLVLVLKGAPTVIGSPDGKVYVNPTGNSGLATGGTGDVLTGLLTGIIAQGASPLDAAIAAVFLHGLAADLAVPGLTEYCLCAGDLIDYLPAAFRSVLSDRASPR